MEIFIGILNDPKSFKDARNIKNISLGVDYSIKLLRYLDTLLPNYIEKVNQCVDKLGIDSIKKVDREENSSTLEDPVVYPDENQRFLNNFMYAFLHNEGSIGTVITAYQLPEDLFIKFGEEAFPTKISKLADKNYPNQARELRILLKGVQNNFLVIVRMYRRLYDRSIY